MLLTPFTTLDFKDHLACIIWLSGCNLKCKYCYNLDIVNKSKNLNYLSLLDIKKFLISHRFKLDAVVLSGGECTNHKLFLDLVFLIKELGYKIKVDTNGTRSDVLSKVIEKIDFISLDFKAPKKKLKNLVGLDYYDELINLIKLLLDKNINFEIRTTFDNRYLNSLDIIEIYKNLKKIGYKSDYFIQTCFIDGIRQEYNDLEIFNKFNKICLRGFNTNLI